MVQLTWINDADSMGIQDVRQVYSWIFDAKGEVIIVSKDGTNWQLPGGKPEKNESLLDALKREVYEESGVNLKEYNPHLFGHYLVANDPSYNNKKYAQVRYFVKLSNTLIKLTPGRKTSDESIRFVRKVSLDELLNLIPWMGETGEYAELKKLGLIK